MCWTFGPGYFWWGGMWGFPFMWVFPLTMMLIAALVIYLIFGQGRYRRQWEAPRGQWSETASMETPLDIVKRRYAKGEINREELEDIKRRLLT